MVGITVGLVITALLAFTIARYALPKAGSLGDVRKLALFTTVLSLAMLALALAARSVLTYNTEAISAEPVQSIADLPDLVGQRVFFEGIISAEQRQLGTTDYVAYLRWDGLSSDPQPDDIEYELADLTLDLPDGNSLTVDGRIYNDINWPQVDLTGETYRFLERGDTIIAYGELYEATRLDVDGVGDVWHVSSPFVYFGDVDSYSAEYAPTLRRTALYAQIVQYASVVLAGLTFLSPLPHLARTQRSNHSAT